MECIGRRRTVGSGKTRIFFSFLFFFDKLLQITRHWIFLKKRKLARLGLVISGRFDYLRVVTDVLIIIIIYAGAGLRRRRQRSGQGTVDGRENSANRRRAREDRVAQEH